MTTTPGVKVSVVVPVYNPGPYMDECRASLLRQTLPPGQLELIFVDDGSTDETPARLDRLAEEHPHVRVIHIPNSGWPGKPRNVGVEAAAGDYIQYVDQDDHLGSDALRRLYELGHANRADIVIGKVVSNFRGVPSGLWKITRERCTIHDTPLWDSLTPHKMFRRAFLEEHRIRFPEGKRRLEDQLYMMRAYFPAKTVSILGDYTCYYYWRRGDKRNAGSTRTEPRLYYDNLREVLDVVTHHTESGDFRDTILRRFYRVELLRRLNERALPTYSPEYREELFTEIRKLALERFPPSVPAALPADLRLRSALVLADQLDGLMEYTRRCREVNARARLNGIGWKGDSLRLTFTIDLRRGPGREEPFDIIRSGKRDFLDPQLTEGLVDWQLGEVTADRPKVSVTLRNRKTAVEWPVAAAHEVRFEDPEPVGKPVPERAQDMPVRQAVYLRGVATLDPRVLGGQDRLERGGWDVELRVVMFGFDRRTRIAVEGSNSAGTCFPPAIVGTPPAPFIPYTTKRGTLGLDVDRYGKTLADALAEQDGSSPWCDGTRVEVMLPVVAGSAIRALPCQAVLRRLDTGPASETPTLPARLQPTDHRMRLVVDLRQDVDGRLIRLAGGPYRLAARLDGADGPEVVLGTLELPAGAVGRLVRRGARTAGLVHLHLLDLARRIPRRVARRLRRRVEAAVRSRKR